LLDQRLVEDYNYRVFSARYGNVYTSRQLVQLLDRAYGVFFPQDDIWQGPDGRFIDPFRPQIQPKGFASEAEFRADRQQHFAAIRRAVEELDVFVFTLGLTETWASKRDGAVYPLCPGVAGGVFDGTQYEFLNLTVNDVTNDLSEAIGRIRAKNPNARIILTVSPVPLAATAEDRSVLVSTTYSKSVLRVAAEQVASSLSYVAYYPSYEIITGAYSRGSYFASDLRSVTEAGVAHVMRLFMRHYASDASALTRNPSREDARERTQLNVREIEQIAKVICEEELLDAR
jgi:GSCFA family